MTKLTKFAIVELNSQTDILANLQSIELGIKIASERGTCMVILPENAFCFGKQGFASQYFDALKAWSAQAARHYGVYLLAGTLPCPYRPDGTPVADGKLRQSSLLFDPAGDCLARYDKIHLFKATVNDSTGNYDEGRTFEAGNALIVADTEFGKVGMMVCFDIRFPTLAVKLRELGADILTAPSAFTYQTGKAHWHALLTARALDSQCMVIGAGQTGDHVVNPSEPSKVRSTWGHSEFISSDGESVLTQKINAASYAVTDAANDAANDGVTRDFDFDITNNLDDLPISAKAASWLPKSDNRQQLDQIADKTTFYQQAPSVIFADFDADAQQITRQNIALLECQKLSIMANNI
ncbi:nitrilase [Moraxella osloensis]|uniref:(R)-stereoselective amidase n=1 Tax=Faucicola osloensis TaxID=34062 RepID=A0A378Q814_FAUOS|nr:nitrilase-related carbon-nitrogen hydrolase [Moraxella osloensis]AME00983.1 nitrilase [Moraxella osloensis]OBX51613.1 nitrilase [Moraxella osloensis]STY96950.1 (R)-stereoselective amidase [Moraxella osloensis]